MKAVIETFTTPLGESITTVDTGKMRFRILQMGSKTRVYGHRAMVPQHFKMEAEQKRFDPRAEWIGDFDTYGEALEQVA